MRRRHGILIAAAAMIASGYVAVGYSFIHTTAAADRLIPLIEKATAKPYSRSGAYPWPVDFRVMSAPIKIGADGVPVVKYGSVWKNNPTTVAQWGLWSLRVGNRADAVRAAEWLLERQQPDGRWLYRIRFVSEGKVLHPPWSSAIVQAQAMSLFTRLWRLTGDLRYLNAARRSLPPLLDRMTSCFDGDCRLPFYELYPGMTPSHVLNGHMWALLGLYDMAPFDRRAANGYVVGRRTLLHVLPLYEVRGHAAYSLAFRRTGIVYDSPPLYLAVEAILLRTLDSITANTELKRAALARERQLRGI